MSHITKQIGQVEIQNVNLLARACSFVREAGLDCNLKLDMNQKSCRYYGGRQQACDGVITFDRQLTPQQQNQWYEIGLKKETNENGKEFYAILSDFNAADKSVTKRWQNIQTAYRLEELKDRAIQAGCIIVGTTQLDSGLTKLVLQHV